MMRALSLSELQKTFGGQLINGDAEFSQLVIDSRKVSHGDLFVALKGERFDGHQFCSSVVSQGAVALVVSEPQPLPVAQWLVADTHLALAQIASFNRQLFTGPVISVTGNSGKTTVKEMLGAILSLSGCPLITSGNFNNDIGVPLTLLRLQQEHDYAVIELGANHLGEIAYTADLARPQAGIVLNVTGAHLGEFGSMDNIALAKSELLSALPDHGVAIINGDDAYAPYWLNKAEGRRTLVYSVKTSPSCDTREKRVERQVGGHSIQATTTGYYFVLCMPDGEFPVQLNVPARHNVSNALAAAAGAYSLGIPSGQIVKGLEQFSGIKGRLQTLSGLAGATLLNDSYNANPGAVQAAVDTLMDFPGKRILVLGDVGELGDEAERLHFEMGIYARSAGVDELWTQGTLSQNAARGFGEDSRHFDDQVNLIAELKQAVTADSVLLIKGSRSAAMDKVSDALMDKSEI
ncbi:UDP-N-acetylmuramoyl-tripeptide--D-alanyl-D-alanine ligase [Oceanospirillum sediminis]|uniref:UDP-N-acetylmuramoyl-tripeptide--D-alanyl-D-alanine ligase n=1 Tax=Oceanospirillum sediminis TaxID=2760088 RepID=A0A839IJZ1_9GAMM|nr:UDP-N-acetylmuramoyl-tripeptide--D-alanyl-D-alanine ligase [Oceanospirillum sediminis]MBB1485485.1 UDP-N-acetylmuramoyl-tripeptide--D-alanyl-D-alanine ligase [Oceanospirillum sediminis]